MDIGKPKAIGGAYADTISEIISAAGVTVDGVKLKDSCIVADNFAGKNAWKNGTIKVSQRGETHDVPATGATTPVVDQFIGYNSSDAGTLSFDRVDADDLGAPGTDTKSYAIKITNDAGNDTNLGTSQYARFAHCVEGYDFARFVGQAATLSFWVRSSKTGVYSIMLLNSGADKKYITTFSVSSADTWEKKTINVTFDYSGGTWNYTTGSGIQVYISLAAGSDLISANLNSWITTATVVAGTGQVNFLNETNTIYFKEFQLELGSEATEFENLDYGTELARCRRYLYVLNMDALANMQCGFGMVTTATPTSRAFIAVHHGVPLRVAATSITATGTFNVIGGSVAQAVGSPTLSVSNPNLTWFYVDDASGTDFVQYSFARYYTTGTGDRLIISAELS